MLMTLYTKYLKPFHHYQLNMSHRRLYLTNFRWIWTCFFLHFLIMIPNSELSTTPLSVHSCMCMFYISIPNADIWLSSFCRTWCLEFFSFGQSSFWSKTCRDLGRNKHFDFVIFDISILIRTSQICLFFKLHIIHSNRQNLTSHTFYTDKNVWNIFSVTFSMYKKDSRGQLSNWARLRTVGKGGDRKICVANKQKIYIFEIFFIISC